MDSYTSYSEAREEARRLTKVHGREVETTTRDCECDYSPNCGLCYGEGAYYLLIYASCGHLLGDGSGEECEQRKCLQREAESLLEGFEIAEEVVA